MDKRLNTRLLMTVCYAVVAGVGLFMAFGSDWALYRPLADALPGLGRALGAAGRWPASTWMMVASGAFAAAGAAFLWFKRPRACTAALLAAGVLLGGGRFYQAVDVTDPRHISHFLTDQQDKVSLVRGTVVQEPDQRERYVNLVVQPEELAPDADKPAESMKLPTRAGLMLVRVYPGVGEYYGRASYGDRVEVRSPLMPTKDLTNPSGFDYGRYLRVRGIHATSPPWGLRHPGQVRYLGPGRVSFLVRVSLALKAKLLQSIRHTMPYPESAFLGGVTLGLRAGLPQEIKMQFQETGVAHVLAVSGLHVGFVHALLWMLCRVFRVPRRASYFVIVLGLIMFAIITGASPATRRAVLMSSIGQGIHTFGGFGIYASTVLTIPLAGLILLLANPLLAPDGSFVLSIVAVWSLAHLSGPSERIIRLFESGWRLAAAVAAMAAWTLASVLAPDAFHGGWAWAALFALFAVFFAAASRLERVRPIRGFDLSLLPGWLRGLLIAQCAILIGMTFPLSALYFQRFSISGVYANLIAIPLIGFIVQLGLLAGLLDLAFSSVGLPGAGTAVALCMNASNWFLCRFFLDVTAFFSKHFPYPYLPSPGVKELLIFYALVLGLVFWEPIAQRVALVWRWAATPARRYALVLTALALVAVPAARTAFPQWHGELSVVFFDVGQGNSALVRTPRGRAILIDGGSQGRGGWGTGETVLAPALAKFNVRGLEAVVLTCVRDGSGGGLDFVLRHFPARTVFAAVDPRRFSSRMTLKGFLAALGDPYLYARPEDPESHETFVMMHELWGNPGFREPLRTAKRGDVLFREKASGGEIVLEVLWPPEPIGGPQSAVVGTPDDLGNRSMVLRLSYGKVSFLLASQLGQAGEWALLESARPEQLRADWLALAAGGNAASSTREFLDAVGPSRAVMQTGYVGWRDRRRYHAAGDQAASVEARCRSRGIEVFRTDLYGAVTVTTDGRTSRSETVLPAPSARDRANADEAAEARDTQVRL
jgi:competence protein ComEC